MSQKQVKDLSAKANAGDPEAMFILGLMYYEGDGVEEDKERARQLWEKAAEKGVPEAMFNLGSIYDKGDGVEEDKERARRWWEKAAEKGVPEAMFNLGVMYLEGDGVEEDKERARRWWEKAAEKGYPEAMFNLGLIYDKGDGIEKDKGQARQWWKEAALSGNILGYMLSNFPDPDIGKVSLALLSSFNDLLKRIERLKNDRLEYREDRAVAHYTDMKALRSMLSEGKNVLRMYNIGYVNDPSEGRSLVQYSRKKEGEGYVLHRFFESDEEENEEAPPVVYFASFSLKEDSLELWRPYGRDGAGVCLVIPARVFSDEPGKSHVLHRYLAANMIPVSAGKSEEQAEEGEEPNRQDTRPALTLYWVRYEDKDKEEALKALNEPLKKIHEEVEKSGFQDEARNRIHETVRMILGDILYLYKNAKYKSEQEVRLLAARPPTARDLKIEENVRDDETRHLYIETRPFLFETDGYRVILGPKMKDRSAARMEIEYLWHKYGFPGRLEIKSSKVPYR